jgi:hypothetical protein
MALTELLAVKARYKEVRRILCKRAAAARAPHRQPRRQAAQ